MTETETAASLRSQAAELLKRSVELDQATSKDLQIKAEDLENMSPDEINQARRLGRLNQLMNRTNQGELK